MEYREQVYDFAEKYMDYFLDIRTTKELSLIHSDAADE